MSEILTYTKYKNCKNILLIELKNNFSLIVIKTFNQLDNIYIVEFRIKENSVDNWALIEKLENVEFNSNYKNINKDIIQYIEKLLKRNFFDYYIDRYNYELQCFDIGNNILEIEKLGANNV